MTALQSIRDWDVCPTHVGLAAFPCRPLLMVAYRHYVCKGLSVHPDWALV